MLKENLTPEQQKIEEDVDRHREYLQKERWEKVKQEFARSEMPNGIPEYSRILGSLSVIKYDGFYLEYAREEILFGKQIEEPVFTGRWFLYRKSDAPAFHLTPPLDSRDGFWLVTTCPNPPLEFLEMRDNNEIRICRDDPLGLETPEDI